MKRILSVIGARPQFIKHACIEHASGNKLQIDVVHTGQHYDENMSSLFFEQLKINSPKYFLEIGSLNHGSQTGKMMEMLEPIIIKEKPEAVLVYGDTNSTLAGALVASKLHIPVIHVEAGLRSFNRQMPEEINRVVTDHVSDILFAPTDDAIFNLKNEGISKNVYRCGDVMCDMIISTDKTIRERPVEKPYIYVTIHRPYNTDEKERLLTLLSTINQFPFKAIFPIHPRTKNKMRGWGVNETDFNNITFLTPLGYVENVAYQRFSEMVITDSGGIQKEAYILKKKCITIRPETEWVETLEGNWNALCFKNLNELIKLIDEKPVQHLYKENIYGDGKAGEFIVDVIASSAF